MDRGEYVLAENENKLKGEAMLGILFRVFNSKAGMPKALTREYARPLPAHAQKAQKVSRAPV